MALTHLRIDGKAVECETGLTILDAARCALDIELWEKIGDRCLRYTVWFGGWSWLQPPSGLKTAHEFNIYIAALGMCFALRRGVRARRPNADGRLGLLQPRRVPIGLRVHHDRLDAQAAAGPQDAQRDLPSVRDE